jgi:hypothetical protein
MKLVNYLQEIPDPRRGQGKQYDLGSLLLFCIMAVLSGSTSYRKIQRFIHTHRERLNQLCDIEWKRAPAHNSIRYALHLLDAKEVENAFRAHASLLQKDTSSYGSIAMDGKVLRGSFDRFEDRKAAQVLSAFATESELVLGHIWITDDDGEKQHEIQAVQDLVKELDITGQLFTLDALHTQKND